MQQHPININYSARYFTLGEITPAIQSVWFVCHGYGQMANYFIKNFNCLNNGKNYIIAPEALSRFYLKNFSGRVGATWMTREDRLTDIDNYVRYLDTVYEAVIHKLAGHPVKISLLGFSQGAATISRWAMQSNIPFDQILLWAGIFPPDLDFEKGKEKWKNKKTYVIYGDKDPYLDEQRLEEQNGLAAKLGIVPETIVFSGKHEINEEVLRRFD